MAKTGTTGEKKKKHEEHTTADNPNAFAVECPNCGSKFQYTPEASSRGIKRMW
jgi:hypothetical protein